MKTSNILLMTMGIYYIVFEVMDIMRLIFGIMYAIEHDCGIRLIIMPNFWIFTVSMIIITTISYLIIRRIEKRESVERRWYE